MKTVTGGHLMVRALEAQGVDRVFCVPGESYHALLEGLYHREIATDHRRLDPGAAMMA